MVAAVLGAARYLQIDIDVTATVRGDQLPDNAAPLLGAVRIADAQFAQAMRQARQIRRQPPRLAGSYRNDLVDAVAEQKAAIERRDARLAQRHQAAIQVAGR